MKDFTEIKREVIIVLQQTHKENNKLYNVFCTRLLRVVGVS